MDNSVIYRVGKLGRMFCREEESRDFTGHIKFEMDISHQSGDIWHTWTTQGEVHAGENLGMWLE